MSFFKDAVQSASSVSVGTGNNSEDYVATATLSATGVSGTTITSTGRIIKSAGLLTAGTVQTQAGATALAYDLNLVTTGNASDGCVLPAAVVGMEIELCNASVNAGVLFGNGTDTVNGTAGATGVAYAASKTIIARCFEAGKWRTMLSN